MLRTIAISWAALCLGQSFLLQTAHAQADNTSTHLNTHANADAQVDPAEKAVRDRLAALAQALNAGKAADVGALFLEGGELVDEDLVVHSGRAGVVALAEEFFKAFPQAKMNVEIESVRFLDPQLAVVELVRSVSVPGTPARAHTRASVTLKEENGAWMIASVRDEAAEDELTPHEHLEPLAWMVGDWVDEGSDALVTMSCKWSPDENFLLCDYRVKREGETKVSSQVRIGWDPAAEQFRSWVFESDGGFAEARWTQLADRWMFKSVVTLPDGTPGSATFFIEPQGPDRFVMRGVDRVAGDEPRPDTEVIVVRRPPQTAPDSKDTGTPDKDK